MRLRVLLLFLLALLPAATQAATTPTEARAIAAAKSDRSAYSLPPEKLAKAVHIAHFYDTLHFAGAGWGMLELLLILRLGVAARMRDFAIRIGANRWTQCFVFSLQLLVLLTLLNLPVSLYAHHESVSFGFSIQSWPSWFGDLAKSFLITYIVGALLVMLLFFLIRRYPERWWVWLWAAMAAIVLGSVYLTPYVYDPLFNQFTPLSQTDAPLVRRLEEVAAHGRIDIPPDHIFLMKASAKTTLLNAYVTGFGSSKRLVLYDTLLKQATPDEILIIAGHEMGHYVLGHVLRGTLIAVISLLLAFFVGFHAFRFALRRWGARWRLAGQDDWAALALMLLVLRVLSFAAEPIDNATSRGMEHDADVFGQEVVHGIVPDPQATGVASNQLLGETSFDVPNPPALLVWWLDSHPSTSFRAAFARHYDPWAAGESPRFFNK